MDRRRYRIIGYGPWSSETRKSLAGENHFLLRCKATLAATGDLRGAVITCRSGLIWLTQKGDPRDYMLRSGKEVTISRKGTLLIQSLDDALFSIAVPRVRKGFWSGFLP